MLFKYYTMNCLHRFEFRDCFHARNDDQGIIVWCLCQVCKIIYNKYEDGKDESMKLKDEVKMRHERVGNDSQKDESGGG